jgi:hypothetical protein
MAIRALEEAGDHWDRRQFLNRRLH